MSDIQHSLITSVQTESIDFSELASYYSDWNAEYKQLSSGNFRGTLNCVETPLFTLINDFWTETILVRGCLPEGVRIVSAITHQTTQRYKSTPIEQGELITAVGGTEIDYQTHGACDALALFIPENTIESFLKRTGRIAAWSEKQEVLIPKSSFQKAIQTGMRWKDCLTRLNEAEQLPAVEQQMVINHALDEILDSITDESEREPPHRIRRKRLELANQAKAYLENSTSYPVTLAELCNSVEANERTLLLGFSELMGCSPVSYHRAYRYNMARTELTNSASETMITEVALRWGFYHLGRFSTGYRLHFGETPSETLRRGRNRSG